jgi:hypothetical protein
VSSAGPPLRGTSLRRNEYDIHGSRNTGVRDGAQFKCLRCVVRALIPSEPSESTHTEAEQLRQLAASDVESTADLEDTADLQAGSATDRTPPTATNRSYATRPAALQELEATPSVDSESHPANDASAADLIKIHDLPLTPMPKQRALGFITFATCAVIAILFTIHRQTGSSDPRTDVITAATPPTDKMQLGSSVVGAISASSRELQKPAETRARQDAQGKSERAGASAPLGVVTFESRSFATSERAVAAVFIVKRTQFVRGKVLVHWAARSGSADAGIDFSDASGTARFADGQRQLAIYVPLRNDLLNEADETFKVCLRSPRQARIGGKSCAEATIRDDDEASRI